MAKLIIFDMDGLMIDSEPLHRKAFDRVFSKYGSNLTEEDNNKYYVGISDNDAARDMINRYKLPLTPEELTVQKQKEYAHLLKEVTPKKGLNTLLVTLRDNGYKAVIASSSSLEEIAFVISSLKINAFIDSYFSAQQVLHGKPSPDLFLFAAQHMHTSPSECLVLEDAPSGVRAAKSAGMKCIAIPSRETKNKDFSEATLVLESLDDVYEELRHL